MSPAPSSPTCRTCRVSRRHFRGDGDNNRLLASTTLGSVSAIDSYDINGSGARTVLYSAATGANYLDVDNIDGVVNYVDYGAGGTYKIINATTAAAVTGGQVGHLMQPLKISTWTGAASDLTLSTLGNWDVAPTFTSSNQLVVNSPGPLTLTNDRPSTTLGGLNVASGSGAVTISGGVITFNQIGRGIVNLSSAPFVLDSATSFTSQPIEAAAGSVTLTGSMSVNGRLFSRGTQRVTLGGAIGGAGSIVKLDANTLRLAGDNTFAGGVLALGGTVELAHGHALGTGPLIVRTGATARIAEDLATPLTINTLTVDTGGMFDLRQGGSDS